MTSFGSFPRLSRRELTLGFLLAGVSASSSQSLIGGQAEWRQSYDAVTSLSVARSSKSVLSPMTAAATEQMIERYRQIVAQGGWPAMPKTTLRLGQK
ncbi:MAG: murein L,D-transpeptidase, partial [Beijerinckiaceae bacterium]|nr:murein L,D-transpeptidase [Beijerinckiaceae bacterium]